MTYSLTLQRRDDSNRSGPLHNSASLIENLAVTLQLAARQFGSRPAVSRGSRVCFSYSELAERSARIAAGLIRFGLEPGDAVGLVMTNCTDFYPVLYGIWHAGLVAVPVAPGLSPGAVAQILDDASAKLCFVTPDRAEAIIDIATEPERLISVIVTESEHFEHLLALPPSPVVARAGHELAWMFYTRGGVERPRGVMLSHGNLIAMATSYLDEVDSVTPRDCIIHVSSMSQGSGMVGLAHVMRGANHIIPSSGGFEANETVTLIRCWPRGAICLPSAQADELMRVVAGQPACLHSLKTLLYSGGSARSADIARALERIAAAPIQAYNLAETPLAVTCIDEFERR